MTSSGEPTTGSEDRVGPDQLAAWRSFLRAHARVVRALEADLVRTHDLPIAAYDVLVQLVEAPDHRLRMTELADLVLLSRSGITRLVDRLSRDGLVRREPTPDDARGVAAVLTDEGYARLRAASSTHLGGVRDYVVRPLGDEDLATLGRVCDRLLAGADGTEPADPADGRASASTAAAPSA